MIKCLMNIWLQFLEALMKKDFYAAHTLGQMSMYPASFS